MGKIKRKGKYVPPMTDGLFRVRDSTRETDPPRIWGENLTHREAVRVKEEVCGQRRSHTAMIEPMPDQGTGVVEPFPSKVIPTHPTAPTVSVTDGSVTMSEAHAAALRAARAAATTAQHRSQSQVFHNAPPPPPLDPVPEDEDGEEFAMTDADVGDINDLLGDVGGPPSAADIQAAHQQAERDWKVANDELIALERSGAEIPHELVHRIGRVPEGYLKDGNVWRPAPTPTPPA